MSIATLVLQEDGRIGRISSYPLLQLLSDQLAEPPAPSAPHSAPSSHSPVNSPAGRFTNSAPGQGGLVDYAAEGMGLGELLERPAASLPPDLIVFAFLPAARVTGWRKLLAKWGALPFMLSFSGEAVNANHRIFDYRLSYDADSASNLSFNFALLSPFVAPMLYKYKDIGQAREFSPHCRAAAPPTNSSPNASSQGGAVADASRSSSDGPNFSSNYGGEQELAKLQGLYKLRKYLLSTPKDRFCNFIYSHPGNANFPLAVEREKLCQELSHYKHVDCAGKVMHNTDELNKIEAESSDWIEQASGGLLPPDYLEQRWAAKLKYIARHKFTIAAENTSSPNYITEKILHPLIAGSIPIYMGSADITKLVNPQVFINCNDYASLAEVAERVKQIDQDPKLYQEYISAPPFLPDSDAHNYSKQGLERRMHPLREKLQQHLSAQRAMRNDWSNYGRLRRWLLTLRAKPLAITKILSDVLYRRMVHRLRR